MIEAAAWVWNARSLITLMIIACVLAQTMAAVLGFYRRSGNRVWLFENTLETVLLAQALVCSLLPGQLLYGLETSLIPAGGYAAARIVVFAILSLSAAAVCVRTRKPWALIPAAAAFLTLPMMEALPGALFSYLFVFEALFLLARSIRVCLLRFRELKTNLSALSVKSAIDSLHTGVLFSEVNGHILLSNSQMQRLMTVISGKVDRNGNRFYELLQAGEIQPGCEKRELEMQMVYLLPDHSAWMFTRVELPIGGKTYFQLSAADITERWELTERLRRQEDRLRQQSEEISETIANLHVLSHEMETQKAKMRAHDILGERLTLLQRAIRGGRTFDPDLLRSLSYGLIDELKTVQMAPTPQDALDSLKEMFGAIGVEVETGGALPADGAIAGLFSDIAREAVTNAVKHGFATRVDIQMSSSGDGHRLEISDNGFSASGDIKESGGLSGMRRRLEPFGGALAVETRPRFKLVIDLPDM